jgi:hypothetical protein
VRAARGIAVNDRLALPCCPSARAPLRGDRTTELVPGCSTCDASEQTI